MWEQNKRQEFWSGYPVIFFLTGEKVRGKREIKTSLSTEFNASDWLTWVGFFNLGTGKTAESAKLSILSFLDFFFFAFLATKPKLSNFIFTLAHYMIDNIN